ncbi:hypothetical protein [Streptomyces sp. 11-1-2]|uniref:hypothetical protein n=1 Tax=Streptomyces sp. 11-1-2 TaxID=1851167 RepID=UPI001F08A33C|nr:hypothetical protein [Streptomyces sp. 11-1-2]
MTRDTTDVGGRDVYPAGSRYGYGIASIPLSRGGVYWGHGGDLPATQWPAAGPRPAVAP